MANAVSNVLAPAFSQFFDALVSGSQNFGEAFKNMLKSILSQIVATIAQAAILSAIFSAFGLGGGSAGGFMGLFKSFLGIGAKPMAAGGLVTAPTYALVGEAGPEAVIPLDRMNELMAGRLEVADTYIRGEDIVQIWKVVSSRNQRKF
jgi:phage-related minor tail protein